MSLVRFEFEDDVARVTLDRPEKRNALSPELLSEILHVVEGAAGEQPRALLLQGAGKVFCAGGDIASMQDRLGDPKRTERTLREHLNPVIEALDTFPAPTVAKVQGAAVGAGLGLALACDLVVVADGAKLGAVHARLGLTPDGGTSWYLPRLLGEKRALEMVLTARTLDGADAVELGLASRAVSREDLDGVVEALLLDLASGPTRAFVKARELLRRAGETTLPEALEREAHSQGLMYATEDQREGVEAFLEDREPRFEGR